MARGWNLGYPETVSHSAFLPVLPGGKRNYMLMERKSEAHSEELRTLESKPGSNKGPGWLGKVKGGSLRALKLRAAEAGAQVCLGRQNWLL